jgi:hypothetical protein
VCPGSAVGLGGVHLEQSLVVGGGAEAEHLPLDGFEAVDGGVVDLVEDARGGGGGLDGDRDLLGLGRGVEPAGAELVMMVMPTSRIAAAAAG